MDRRNLLKTVTLAGSALALPALVAPAMADKKSAAAPLIEKFAATLSAHDLTAFAALFSDNYVNHQLSAAAPPPPQGKSPKQGTVAVFTARLAGIPDLKVEIEATVASGDRAAASFVYSGTHNGPLSGVAPTGRALRFTSCDIFRVQSGLIIEHWGMGDIAGVLAQLKA
ncbi:MULTISPECIES: ester cyclase [unclassified Bradyrhizobium]|uniref:ester cyclase n=1 Tax=unclassified Bradyrhizobium TaxID=2631580 RepID=UPI0009E41F81|nr:MULTISPECIES: ester cyclase [unclassified Bradyrhizobium]